MASNPISGSNAPIVERAQALFDENQRSTYERTDKLFAILLALQWIAGIAAAVWISPRTWAGTASETHVHVLAAIFLGGLIAALPIALALILPGKVITRHIIAIGQMLASALLIHLCGGRIETHFHIFGSLAFLAFYRDWRVLITATVVVAADHLFRGMYWPQSIFGVLTASPGRAFEHAGWVLFEDIFLIYSINSGLNRLQAAAHSQAQLEATNKAIVEAVDNVRATANSVESNSLELNATADQLSSDANQQSSSVNQTIVSVERIAEMISQSTSNAQQTDVIAQECAGKATQGGQAVQDTIRAMKQIAEKIKSVEDIAQNTDLLALNAEVQAARFGEEGRGFAVVAMEIRRLAELTRATALEISELSLNSVNIAERAGGLLEEIVPSVQQTATLIQNIAQATVEQNHSLGEMKSAMDSLNESSRRNAETSELLSTTAKDMSTHVEKLQYSMATLDIDEGSSANTDQ